MWSQLKYSKFDLGLSEGQNHALYQLKALSRRLCKLNMNTLPSIFKLSQASMPFATRGLLCGEPTPLTRIPEASRRL